MAFLSRPDSYSPPAARVETRETHLSWVFLTETHAYKLKKPVRLGYVDYGTLGARYRTCTEELRLNERLAPGVYLEVVPLVRTAGGALHLGAGGAAVEWLVRMRRLPESRMLDFALAKGTATDGDAERIGTLLGRFYESAPLIALPLEQYLRGLENETRFDEEELARPEYRLPLDALRAIVEAQRRLLAAAPSLFDARAGRIVDAHGDLRPEHVCLEKPPVIIDRLEFDPDLRVLDAAAEMAFLWLECERLGAPRFGRLVFERYCHVAGDHPPRQLIEFYRRWHACVRARIAVWHLRDARVADPEKWIARGGEYLRLALTPLEGPDFWIGR